MILKGQKKNRVFPVFSDWQNLIRFQLREDAARRWPCAIAPV